MHFADWIKAVILGIVEGLTEFLPVSSTGHLIIAGRWLGFNSEMFDIFIQLGALAAVWWLFRDRIFQMIPIGNQNPQGRKLGLNILLAFIPVLAIGFFTRHWNRDSVIIIAWASIIGGIIILLVEGFKPRPIVESLETLTPSLAICIGLGQCLALCPGVSRSGATIMMGLAIGLSRSVATEFTFLLAVPTMTTVTLYALIKHRSEISVSAVELLAIGFVVSFVVALLVVKWFIRFVQRNSFEGFAWYRIVAGALVLALLSNGFFNQLK